MVTYRINVYNSKTNDWDDFGGGYSKDDVKKITKGYRKNGLFYERKGSKKIYEVVEE